MFSLSAPRKVHAHIPVLIFVHSLLSISSAPVISPFWRQILGCSSFVLVSSLTLNFLRFLPYLNLLLLAFPFFSSSQLIAMLRPPLNSLLLLSHPSPFSFLPPSTLIREFFSSTIIRKHNLLSAMFSEQPSKILFSF